MRLNTIKPAEGSKRPRLRVGRGKSAGQGKTCGRGHKGQRARKGGYHKVGFEGGQMPLQRRLPKFGFRSQQQRYVAELRLHELAKAAAHADGGAVDLAVLKRAGLVGHHIERVRVIASGKLEQAVVVSGLELTKGARAAVEAAGGRVDDQAK
jgi:large subunit ribosomal protein L15